MSNQVINLRLTPFFFSFSLLSLLAIPLISSHFFLSPFISFISTKHCVKRLKSQRKPSTVPFPSMTLTDLSWLATLVTPYKPLPLSSNSRIGSKTTLLVLNLRLLKAPNCSYHTYRHPVGKVSLINFFKVAMWQPLHIAGTSDFVALYTILVYTTLNQ